jgi:hypothetical protein
MTQVDVIETGLVTSVESPDQNVTSAAAGLEMARVKNDVLAAIVERIEARNARVEFGTTLYGFAQYNRQAD